MHDDFVAHGKKVIEKVRWEKPDQYLRVIASILPKELYVKPTDWSDVTDEELGDIIAALRSIAGTGLPPSSGNRTGAPKGKGASGRLPN
ncbi:MAG: hypothetical protein WC485_08395 [Opitutaceae bacterium]